MLRDGVAGVHPLGGEMEVGMPDGGKRTVTLELDAGLVDRAERAGPNLAATVEGALRRHVRAHMTDEQLKVYIEGAVEHHAKYGSPGEDYMPV